MLEYRALGGLAVADRGDDVSIGGPRQRRLVAMLLVHRNSVVSADRLSEAVFGRGLRSRPGGVGPVAVDAHRGLAEHGSIRAIEGSVEDSAGTNPRGRSSGTS